MSKKIVGIEPVKYVNKNGKQVTGVKLYILQDMPQEQGVGCKTSDCFISGANAYDYVLGEILTVIYEPTVGNNFRATGVIYKDAGSKK